MDSFDIKIKAKQFSTAMLHFKKYWLENLTQNKNNVECGNNQTVCSKITYYFSLFWCKL